MSSGQGLRQTVVRVGAWTVAWTLFDWWAVIGRPDTLEGNLAALIVSGAATTVGLTVRYVWGGPAAPSDSRPELPHGD